MENVQLPSGVRVKKLIMFANDNSDQDAHVFLVRKLLQDGLSPQFGGYQVMGQVDTSGAANNKMRKFTTTSIAKPRIDNQHYSYFLELVVCDAIEPFAVQVAYQH